MKNLSQRGRSRIRIVAVPPISTALAPRMPSKKLGDVNPETVAKFKDKDFARGADRKGITAYENIGFPKISFSSWP